MKRSLQLRQQQMMKALLGNNDDIADYIIGDQQLDARQRLSIYQSGYRIRLREVIDNDHPVLGSYLGDQLFEQMTEGYIDAHPSTFRSLRHYCDRLPDYLRSDTFFSQYPHIAELARFERGLLSSFDAADRDTVSVADLQQIPPEQWPTLQLRFHPSLQLFNADMNVVEIWQSIKAERTPPNVTQQTEYWVIWRNPERLTEFRSVDTLEQVLLDCFLQGGDIEKAAEITAQTDAVNTAETLLTYLFRWLELGWVQQLTDAQSPPIFDVV
ncbi:DUF2063 domain-containing protein [Amphritea opalescens]|uniref:DUF2063 domain-containing protein n=1 Tax=Amphritea opalescens TaxID=2490544 RepID=A0A430KSR7_9GAMM|nr:DNA-binding domain-containing protein [Amphritea opalescens]RTE66585.1 DUF2063 domain-containing protein [Amphritea opalescens]